MSILVSACFVSKAIASLTSRRFGTYSTSEAIRYGLDLEMPGPSTWRGFALKQAFRSNKVEPWDIDARALNMLKLVKRGLESGIAERGPDCIGDVEMAKPVLRQLASSSIVLLKNERKVLPYERNRTVREPLQAGHAIHSLTWTNRAIDNQVAIIGPNAKARRIHGGGSAAVHATYAVSPFEGIKQKVSAKVTYAKGCDDHKKLPLMNGLIQTPTGKPGYVMRFYAEPASVTSRQPISEVESGDTMVYLTDYTHKSIDGYLYYTELEATFEPEYTGEHTFGLTVYGTGKLFIDDKLIVDNSINQTPGDSFWGAGTREKIGTIELTAGTKHKILVEFGTAPTQTTSTLGSTNMGAGGFRLGCIRNTDAETEIAAAVAVAQAADQVIICAGLNVSIKMVDLQCLMWC